MLNETLAEALANAHPLHVVCERFEFRHDERHRDKIEYVSAEYIGIVKLFCKLQNVKLVMQGASQAKQFFTDDVLKKLAVWVPGRRHAMDGIRHYLYYRTFTLNDKSILHKLR